MEVWKNIPEYDGEYKISNLGRIKSYKKRKEGIIHSQWYDKYGYARVDLCKNSKTKHFQVHRLVALVFIENRDNKPQVNHKNGDRKDNRADNLEWCTCSENIRHSFDFLGRKPNCPNIGKKYTEQEKQKISQSMKEYRRKQREEKYGIK